MNFSVSEIAILAISRSNKYLPVVGEEVTVTKVGTIQGDNAVFDYGVINDHIRALLKPGYSGLGVYGWQLRKKQPPIEPESFIRCSQKETVS